MTKVNSNSNSVLKENSPCNVAKLAARYKARASKLAQLNQKIRLQQDKIGVELMKARNALDQAALEVVEAEAALRSSKEVLELYTFGYEKGQFDLVIINLQESKVTEYQIKLVESREKWYVALAAMQAALGLDPPRTGAQYDDDQPACRQSSLIGYCWTSLWGS